MFLGGEGKFHPNWYEIRFFNDIKHFRPSFTTFQNTKERDEKKAGSRVFLLRDFEKFENLVKQCVESLIYLFSRNLIETKTN